MNASTQEALSEALYVLTQAESFRTKKARDGHAKAVADLCAALAQPQAETAAAPPSAPASEPVDMVLHCPNCGLQHIDAPEVLPMAYAIGAAHFSSDYKVWDNPPHRSHLCHGCEHIWRPADVPTNGVAAVKTAGKTDSPIATHAATSAPAEAQSPAAPDAALVALAAAIRDLEATYSAIANLKRGQELVVSIAQFGRLWRMRDVLASQPPTPPAAPQLPKAEGSV